MVNKDEESLSRRHFLKNTGLVAGGVVGGSLLGGLITNQFQTKESTPTKEKRDHTQQTLQEARMFFSREEDFNTLKAATERIFPEDDHGPGAIKLSVPYFIDKQLAGSWGTNAKAYMKDPFLQNKQTHEYQRKDSEQNKSGPNTSTQAPTPTPRYQSRQNRGEIFLQGLRKMDQVSKEKFDKSFIDLEEKQQNEILQAFENNEIEMKGVSSQTFFNLLRQTTLEGVYADPLYGGNKNMMGWKMKEYPGPRMAYINEIDSEDFIVMEPQSLREYQG
ncbi:gluconate 2-dehydrogenase subunit 3 family protein [Cerasibacillus terrae]|uniref:Gluconate 2-dehydrogenase subunit 3 family protein n=1 Tax=Cerasibacillus terrae TaxID=2498845 RepID=A0A5C8NX09_9BACI|nr:gluconate 2-dehydrogenase subunit 3 family protein [Cerasibacillus terrae]TXL65735.1 gluconate 2-dehydrogenase subunit 3 family protein [Cerasibacillus terrae]